jgi:DNA-binding transcriptional MerR regulator/methylmalonyl-CoA mutase cobalamin-binding subunit
MRPVAKRTKRSGPDDATEPRHPIQVVARRTGLTADVIRAWERRYRAVSPARTETGRRLYSDADVKRLALMRRATEAGRRIGDVANLADEALAALVAADQAPQVKTATDTRPPMAGAVVKRHLSACLTAVENMQPETLESALESARVALSTPVLLDEVITPLIRRIGDGWRSGSMRVAHEHLASAILHPFLSRLRISTLMPSAGPAAVIATLAGQHHELGALMAAVAAASEDWNVIYLGASLPAEEIAYAAACSEARVVGLSIVYPADDPQLTDQLQRLRTALPDSVALMVGGAAAASYSQVLKKIGASTPDDLAQFRLALGQLRSRGSRHQT